MNQDGQIIYGQVKMIQSRDNEIIRLNREIEQLKRLVRIHEEYIQKLENIYLKAFGERF